MTPLPPLFRPLSLADRRTALWLFVTLACLFLLSSGGHFYASDSWQKYLTLKAMMFEHTVFFDEGWTLGLGNKMCSFYPLGGSLLMIPGFLVGYALAPLAPMVPAEFVARFFVTLQNAFFSAGLVALVFVYLRRLGYPVGGSLFATAALGLGSYVWPYAKTCWSEPGATLAVFGAFYLLQVSSDERFNRAWSLFWAGCLLGIALMTRLEIGIIAPGALAWLVWRHRSDPRALTQACVVMAIPLAAAVGACLWFNAVRYGSPLTFSNWNAVQSVTVFPAGGRTEWALRNLWHYTLNPSDGMLWFSPVLVLGFAGMRLFWRAHRDASLLALAAMAPLAIFYIGFWGLSDWAWGMRYGYAFMPFLLLPVAALWVERPALRPLWTGVFILGVAVQALASIHNFGYLYERERARTPGLSIQMLMSDASHAPLLLAWRDAPETLRGGLSLLLAPPPLASRSLVEMREASQFVPDSWVLLQLLTTIPRWVVALAAGSLLSCLAFGATRIRRWAIRAQGT